MPRRTFETDMARLDTVLEQLEAGPETLNASMKLYKEGLSLVESALKRLCQFQEDVLVLEKSANETFQLLALSQSDGDDDDDEDEE